MDLNDLRSLVTLLSLLLFLGLLLWTWWPRRRAEHDAAAQLPFLDEDNATTDGARP
ncbi:cbb3-type cytochrome oxidase subunit 3 [Aquabacterium sp.]|uniref:cbb3-type cytochrome oxidase subunit 3 n=1 Tax=Aquabacterium sp. TaxID=1872578 RepID=UPI002B63EB63|nr:CcoQ/FixQ family Cbb3-type cytochrome c oxidase assembly chaperone [Aquabacterium sp.]HSW05922.1 CcoQ/FixQ family Cbb3-type cytochrome c oxidase assembly chaperone [Aquabacterium sp.]